MWAQAPSAFAQPTNALLSAYFADAGTAGSLPTSRSLCRMMTVAWRLAAIFSKQSINDTVAALPGRQQDRIVLDGPALQIRRGDRPVDSTFYRDPGVHRRSPLLARSRSGGPHLGTSGVGVTPDSPVTGSAWPPLTHCGNRLCVAAGEKMHYGRAQLSEAGQFGEGLPALTFSAGGDNDKQGVIAGP